MRPSHLIDFLTPERARIYALATLILIFPFLAKTSLSNVEGNLDFPAFYSAGRSVNEYPRGSLYDPELQQSLYAEIVPNPSGRMNFAYTPFFALVFAPLARLPFWQAFAAWTAASLAMFAAGFYFISRAAGPLPPGRGVTAFLLSLCYLPFSSFCLLSGQSTAFGFFWLALAVYLDARGRRVWGGAALSLLLYKPTLLPLVLLMLLVTRRWRTLAGFSLGAAALALISLAVIGVRGVPAYLNILLGFANDKVTGGHPIHLDVDALSFFKLLTGGPSAYWLTLAVAALAVPALVVVWRRRPEVAWMTAITWTIILNVYVVIYDSSLIILSIVLTAGLLYRTSDSLPRAFKWILLSLFLLPWMTRQMALAYGFQPLAIALFALGVYQLYVTHKLSLVEGGGEPSGLVHFHHSVGLPRAEASGGG